MPVERLDALLESVWRHRLGLVVAPAGSGKTSLLTRFAARAGGPVGWYRAEGWDRDEQALLRHLEAALAPQLDGVSGAWQTIADAANTLDGWRGAPILLVVDDLHTLEGTAAEAALERLIDYAPASLTVLAAARVPPRFNLPRLRVSGSLIEIGGDDLRLRSWEVERLFRDFYREPLPPEELARLARRTEGWAAGLQLFHLATAGRTPDERRNVLAALGPSSRLMRDYLTRNVLDQLPPDLRQFLVGTSVLGRLNGALCDELLGRARSAELLAELERRRLFTQALPEDGSYRYHEVLRSYLVGVLREEIGESGTRRQFRRAAELLTAAGALPEALEAHCRAEDWEQAQGLLDRAGGRAVGTTSAWIDALPATVVTHDPWLQLASARKLRAEGRLAQAIERYQQAELAFAGTEPAVICRDERLALAVWVDASFPPLRQDWSGLLRAAVAREPAVVARDADRLAGQSAELVVGLSMLLAGNVSTAEAVLGNLAADEAGSPANRAVAALGAALAGLLGGRPTGARDLEGAVAAVEVLGFEWLARAGRAALAAGTGEDRAAEALAIAAACDNVGDRWGAALARLCVAWGDLGLGAESVDLEPLAGEFRSLGAPVLEAWARAVGALSAARSAAPDALEAALQAEALARSAGVHNARQLTHQALSELGTADADEFADLALQLAGESGIALPIRPAPVGSPAVAPYAAARMKSPLAIRLLGGYEIELDGRPVDQTRIRPRVRTLLRLLSLHADAPVHHEALESWLWPDAEPGLGARNLHVAVAALRRALEPQAGRGAYQLIRREGDAYRLVMPTGGHVDLHRFQHALDVARAARRRGDHDAAINSFALGLEEYRGELLPEEGPAEWLTQPREQLRLAAVEAAQSLAELLLRRGEAQAAARVCNRGLRIERYHDPLWRLLIQARDSAGDKGAASRARLGYGQMLAELGLDEAPGGSPLSVGP